MILKSARYRWSIEFRGFLNWDSLGLWEQTVYQCHSFLLTSFITSLAALAMNFQTKTVLLPPPTDGWWSDHGLRGAGSYSILPVMGTRTDPCLPDDRYLGGKKRQYAATKFIIYTAGSSLFILLAALALGLWTGTQT